MKKLLLVALFLAAPLAVADDRWLHINVGEPHETVRVSVPLSWVEKLLPTVHVDRLRHGRLSIWHKHDGISPRELLDAIRNTADGEFVTVDGRDEQVRVAKSGGYLLVKVREGRRGRGTENVDIKLPMKVLEALVAKDKDHLDLAAAIRALSAHGDLELVTVESDREKVRIWVDGKSRQ